MLTKSEILEAKDLKTEKVSVPEWGGHVFVRVMTGAERDDFERVITDDRKAKAFGIRAKLACLTVCDSEGCRLFKESDLPELARKSAPALDRIFSAAMDVNRVSASDVEELEKNSGGGPSDDSG